MVYLLRLAGAWGVNRGEGDEAVVRLGRPCVSESFTFADKKEKENVRE